jgi:hypothetical protein
MEGNATAIIVAKQKVSAATGRTLRITEFLKI